MEQATISKAAHTAGPWHANGSSQIISFDHKYIASALSINFSHGEVLANARLIAAAPELLAALETIAKIGRDDFGPAAASRMDEIARAAISKATGA